MESQTPNSEESITSIDTQAGSVRATIAVGFIGLVAVAVLSAFFLNALRNQQETYDRAQHTSEEAAAYRYAEMRSRAGQAKNACENNASKHQALKIWIDQQRVSAKPPPELLVDAPCTAVIEKEKE